MVLRDTQVTPAQVFFFQLSLHTYCSPGPSRATCLRDLAGSSFFWRGEAGDSTAVRQFGYDERLPDLGQPMLAVGEDRQFAIDLLPKLHQLLQSRVNGLDPELAHWIVDGCYQGQGIWGNVGLETQWRGFRLSASLK